MNAPAARRVCQLTGDVDGRSGVHAVLDAANNITADAVLVERLRAELHQALADADTFGRAYLASLDKRRTLLRKNAELRRRAQRERS